MTDVRVFSDGAGRSLFGPWFSARGVLTQIGRKVQCHICGKCFHHLGAHITRTHELTPNEYCDEFGLKRTTGLISPALAEKRRRQCVFPALSPGERAARSLAARQARRVKWTRPPISLEERLTPGYHERCAHAIDAALEGVKKARENGTYRGRQHPFTDKDIARGRAVRQERDSADPKRVERWRQKLSAARFIPIERICITCGKVFTTGVTNGRRRTCGDSCLDEYRRRKVADMQTDAVHAKLSYIASKRVITRDANGRILSWVRA